MASLGIFFLVVFFLSVFVASCLFGLIFGSVTLVVIRHVVWRDRLAFAAWSSLPFAIWAFVSAPFVFWWISAERTSFPASAPLPNGYTLMMINATDPGWLYKPIDDLPQHAWPKDVVDGVEMLQVTGRYMLGGRDSHGLNFGKTGGHIDSYFVLDGQTRQLTTVSSIQELQRASLQVGISLKLEEIRAVYFRYGPTNPANVAWFCVFPLCLVLMCLLARWIVRLRRFSLSHGSSGYEV